VGLVTLLSEPYLPPGGLGLKVGSRVRSVQATGQVERVWDELLRRQTHRDKLDLTQVV